MYNQKAGAIVHSRTVRAVKYPCIAVLSGAVSCRQGATAGVPADTVFLYCCGTPPAFLHSACERRPATTVSKPVPS